MLPQDASTPEQAGPPTTTARPGRAVAGRITPTAAAAHELPPAPGLSAGPDVWALLRALKRRWASALFLGGTLAGLSAIAAWYLMAPQNTAFAQLRVSSSGQSYMEHTGVNRTEFLTYMRTVAGQVRGRPVILAALKREDVKRLGLERKVPDPAIYVEENLRVEFQEHSELLNILMASPDPAEATTLVKAITAAFMEDVVYAENRAKVQRVADLGKVFTENNDSLTNKKNNLARLAQSLGTSEQQLPTREQQRLLETLSEARANRREIDRDLADVKRDLEALNLRKELIQTAKAGDLGEAEVEAVLAADAQLAPIRARLGRVTDLMADYESKSPRGFMNEPTWRSANREKERLTAQVNARRDVVREELRKRSEGRTLDEAEIQRALLTERARKLGDRLAQADKDVNELATKSDKIGLTTQQMDSLRAEIAREQPLVDDLGRKHQIAQVELRAPQRIAVYQEAELQRKDSKKQLMATLATPAGVLLATCVGLAWFEHRKRRVHTAREVAQGLGLRVVGAVPAASHLERHLADPAASAALEGQPVLESFDALRTLLLHEASVETTRVVMVTSAGPGEGKTTLAGHLANSLARAGRQTLLIDADLRRPAVHEHFELPLVPGFSETLLGEVELGDAIQDTPQENLAVMPAGQWDREVLAALSRDALGAMFEKLLTEFDFIVLDSHPVLPAPDSLLVGRQVDAVILSVLREVSQMPKVYAACQRLASLDVRVLGAVVNGADPDDVFAAAAAPAAAARG